MTSLNCDGGVRSSSPATESNSSVSSCSRWSKVDRHVSTTNGTRVPPSTSVPDAVHTKLCAHTTPHMLSRHIWPKKCTQRLKKASHQQHRQWPPKHKSLFTVRYHAKCARKWPKSGAFNSSADIRIRTIGQQISGELTAFIITLDARTYAADTIWTAPTIAAIIQFWSEHIICKNRVVM